MQALRFTTLTLLMAISMWCNPEPLDHAQAAKVMGDLLVLGKMTGNCERAFLKPAKQKDMVVGAGFSYEKWQAFIITEEGRRLLNNFYKQCAAAVASTPE